MIDDKLLNRILELNLNKCSFNGLGNANTQHIKNMLTFLGDAKFAKDINANKNITGIFVTAKEADLIDESVFKIIVEDPKWGFFTLLDYLGRTKKYAKNTLSPKAKIHPSAVIADQGVIIEDDVCIEAGVVIQSGTIIHKGAIIRAGAVIGCDGFEHKKTSKGLISVTHDGQVIIKQRAEIGPCNSVIKGFSFRDTIIGEETKLDAQIHYAHGVQCGKQCLIAASAMIAGHVTIGDHVWIGPSAVISNRINIASNAFITLGSVVVKHVAQGQKVTGNFAIAHDKFIKDLKSKVN